MNLTNFLNPAAILELFLNRKRGNAMGKRGIPLYQTWHIVNSASIYKIGNFLIFSFFWPKFPSKNSKNSFKFPSKHFDAAVFRIQITKRLLKKMSILLYITLPS